MTRDSESGKVKEEKSVLFLIHLYMPSLTPEELKLIEQEKVITLGIYQGRLDKICDETDSKWAHWNQKMMERLENQKKLWEEASIMLNEQRKRAQKEIHHMIGIPPEEWYRARNNFESKYSNVVSAYNQATSKIR